MYSSIPSRIDVVQVLKNTAVGHISTLPPALLCAGIVASAADAASLLVTLRVARILVEAAAPTDTGEVVPEWVRKLIVAQASAFDRVVGIGDDGGTLARATRMLHACLKSRPHLLAVYLEVLTAEGRSRDSLLALSAVYSFAAGLPLHKGRLCRITCEIPALYRFAACCCSLKYTPEISIFVGI